MAKRVVITGAAAVALLAGTTPASAQDSQPVNRQPGAKTSRQAMPTAGTLSYYDGPPTMEITCYHSLRTDATYGEMTGSLYTVTNTTPTDDPHYNLVNWTLPAGGDQGVFRVRPPPLYGLPSGWDWDPRPDETHFYKLPGGEPIYPNNQYKQFRLDSFKKLLCKKYATAMSGGYGPFIPILVTVPTIGISGIVKDSSGAPVANAQVRIYSTWNEEEIYPVTTDAAGWFQADLDTMTDPGDQVLVQARNPITGFYGGALHTMVICPGVNDVQVDLLYRAGAPGGAGPPYAQGDANRDGQVDSAETRDAFTLWKLPAAANYAQLIASDADINGTVDRAEFKAIAASAKAVVIGRVEPHTAGVSVRLYSVVNDQGQCVRQLTPVENTTNESGFFALCDPTSLLAKPATYLIEVTNGAAARWAMTTISEGTWTPGYITVP